MKLQEIKKSEDRSVLSVLGPQPEHFDGDFDYSNDGLTSLVGSPTSVSSDFFCHINNLKTLVGAPAFVGGDFFCNYNKLTSLDGAPTSIGGDFGCGNNKLTSLAGIHRQIKKIGGVFYGSNNPKLVNNLVGLLLIDGLQRAVISNKKIEAILNKYLPADNKKLAVLQCQQELIEAGFESAADL